VRSSAARSGRIWTITDTIEELAKASLWSEDDIMIVPVLEEILVVRKQLVLKEELHIRRRVEIEAVPVPVTLRKQRAIVEREVPDGSTINEEETDP
jgi:stress response protein YsnF